MKIKMEKSVFETLFEINVNDNVEKKNGLSYLSWPYVWSEVKNRFTEANYKVSETEYGCIYFTDGCVAALAKSRPNKSATDKSTFTRKGLTASESTQGLDKLILRNGSVSYPLERNLPLEISILALYSVPKYVSRKIKELMLNGRLFPTKKPDADNIIKVILDALNGVAYQDDAQICRFYFDSQCRAAGGRKSGADE